MRFSDNLRWRYGDIVEANMKTKSKFLTVADDSIVSKNENCQDGVYAD